jgi:hypothetical protein
MSDAIHPNPPPDEPAPQPGPSEPRRAIPNVRSRWVRVGGYVGVAVGLGLSVLFELYPSLYSLASPHDAQGDPGLLVRIVWVLCRALVFCPLGYLVFGVLAYALEGFFRPVFRALFYNEAPTEEPEALKRLQKQKEEQ